MPAKGNPKARKNAASKVKTKNLDVRKEHANKVKGGLVKGGPSFGIEDLP